MGLVYELNSVHSVPVARLASDVAARVAWDITACVAAGVRPRASCTVAIGFGPIDASLSSEGEKNDNEADAG